MDVIFFLKSPEAVLEIIFLCLAIYHFVRGIKIKEYRKASTFFSLYLILNMVLCQDLVQVKMRFSSS